MPFYSSPARFPTHGDGGAASNHRAYLLNARYLRSRPHKGHRTPPTTLDIDSVFLPRFLRGQESVFLGISSGVAPVYLFEVNFLRTGMLCWLSKREGLRPIPPFFSIWGILGVFRFFGAARFQPKIAICRLMSKLRLDGLKINFQCR